jgi:hypothetical protein
MPLSLSDPRFVRVPLSDITTPKSGRICMGERYWAITPENEALFFKLRPSSTGSPQCNSNRSIVERLLPEGCRVEFVPMAFLPHRCSDYH